MKRLSVVLVRTGRDLKVAYAGDDKQEALKAFAGITEGDEASIFNHLVPSKRRRIKEAAGETPAPLGEESNKVELGEDGEKLVARRKELYKMRREDQEKLAASLKIDPKEVQIAREGELVNLILKKEFETSLFDRVRALFSRP